jgi:hypothetical protein
MSRGICAVSVTVPNAVLDGVVFGGVQKLGAELQVRTFAEISILDHREIPVVDPIRADSTKSRRHVADIGS